MAGTVTVDIPALDPNKRSPRSSAAIFIHATVSADNTQHVSITDNQGEAGFNVHWSGKGSQQIGHAVVDRKSYTQSFTVTIEHNPGLLAVQKPSDVKNPTKSRVGNSTVQTVVSEDGGDQDYDDAIVYFTYLDNTQ